MINKQRGVTMVELMISLLLGLSLLAGISELFAQSQKSNQMQRSLSYMMEDGRYVLEIMSKELRRTGYLRNMAELSRDKLFIGGSDYMNMLGSDTVTPTISLARNEVIHGVSRDAFVLRYQLNDDQDLGNSDPNNSNSPCTRDITLEDGEDPAIENHVVSIYFYVDQDDNGTPELYCRARRDVVSFDSDPPTVSCVAPTDCYGSMPDRLPIISNVERLVVKYGIDYCGINTCGGTNDYDGAADYYVDADEVGEDNWERVVSAKVFVVLRSEEDNLVSNNATYTIEDETYTVQDKRFYRVFSTTVTFRNNDHLPL